MSCGSSTPAPTNIVEFLDLSTMQWETLPSRLPEPVFGHRMAEIEGRATVVGGFFGTDSYQLGDDGEWTAAAELNPIFERARFAIAAVPQELANCD